MKFGKSLSNQIEETLPEWKDKFLSYKDLKKSLKMIDPNPNPQKRQKLDGGEVDFVSLLEDELEKFNAFFSEQEEEYVIRLKELQDRVKRSNGSKDELIKIRKEIIDIHGEMVLLENYSGLNYTGLVKILKKYDKRTGALIRPPFIQKVLQQPFFTTDLLYKLVKECERMLDKIFPVSENPPPTVDEAATNENKLLIGSEKPSTSSGGKHRDLKDLVELEHAKSLHMKSTIAALRVMKEIRSGSSTVNAFSLPPMQIGVLDDAWNKVPVVEQIAK